MVRARIRRAVFFVRKRARRDGAVTFWYLLLYSLGHIAFESLRSGGTYLFGSVRLSQAVCAALAAFALVMLLVRARNPLTASAPQEASADVEKDEPTKPQTDATAAESEPGAENDAKPIAEESAAQENDTPAEPAGETSGAAGESTKEA